MSDSSELAMLYLVGVACTGVLGLLILATTFRWHPGSITREPGVVRLYGGGRAFRHLLGGLYVRVRSSLFS